MSVSKTKPVKKPIRLSMFAQCPPGVESLLAEELKSLSAAQVTEVTGGVAFEGTLELLLRVNVQSRIASRVRVHLGDFEERFLSNLEKRAADIKWYPWFKTEATAAASVHATCATSKIYHSEAAAERFARAIARGMKLKKLPDFSGHADADPDNTVAVHLRFADDICHVQMDSSGSNLHKRGYRLETAKAPLRETLAAAALSFSRWKGDTPLVDPMCGSGTLAIEAALIATRTAPGLNRRFSCLHWPCMKEEMVLGEINRAKARIRPALAPIFASDRDAGAIEIAGHNAARAHMKSAISFSTKALSNVELPQPPGLVICNPPYGERIGDATSLINLYASLGRLVKSNPGWQLCLITSDETLARATKLRFNRTSAPIPNGGLRIRFYATQ